MQSTLPTEVQRSSLIEFNLLFDRPQQISALHADRLELQICGHTFADELQKKLNLKAENCLELEKILPSQINHVEQRALDTLFYVLASIAYFSVAVQLQKSI